MRQTVKRGSARAGARGVVLVAITLSMMLLGPAVAAAIGGEVGPVGPPPPPAPVNTVAPTLTGTPALGQTLTCSTGSWANNPTGFTYAWLRGGVPIAGQAASTYVVQAADQGHAIACRVTAANGGGDYTISGLASGSYKVDFAPAGEGSNYLAQFFSGKASLSAANLVSVTVPGTTANVNAEMHVGGQISGRVTGAPTHGAVANVLVCAEDEAGGEFAGGCTVTNDNGEYTIAGLPNGLYTVEFTAFFEEGNFRPQYYSGKSSSSEANQVAVTAGSTVANIDAELQAGGEISGRVTDTSTHPLEKIVVCAEETTDEFFGDCASTNGNGEYTIVGLPSSSYTVEFSAFSEGANYAHQFWNDKESAGEAEAVVVSAPNTTANIDAEMAAGGQISGTVTDASTHAKLAKIEACAYSASGEFVSACALTNGNGEYTISGLSAGNYRVEFSATDEGGNYLFQYWNGKTALGEAAPVSVTLGATHASIDAELQAGGGIAGRVTDGSSHAPIGQVEVCAGGSGCTTTNANGEYTILQLSSGSYDLEVRDNEAANYLSQTVKGISVTAPGVTSAVNVELHPGAQISGLVTDAATRLGLPDIEVCALPVTEGISEHCAETAVGTASVAATSNALTVPPGDFTQVKKPVFDAKKGELDFFFKFPTPGKLSWSLFFRNSDVGFADSLGLSLGIEEGTLAEAARKSKKSKKCKRGYIKHGRRCVRLLVPFGGGSQGVPAGTVEVKVHASSKAIKALKAGRTLRVSGKFTFQSSLGGKALSKTVSAVVRLPKKHARKHGKGKRR